MAKLTIKKIIRGPTRYVPSDWEYPLWDCCDRVHGWRNYISDEVAKMWNTFTPDQKMAICLQAEHQASLEEWD